MTSTSTSTHGTGRRYSGLAAAERAHARRTAIREAALDLFGTVGFAATSVKQICGAAGLTERYFYESFGDRHEALAGVYTTLVAQLQAATEAALAGADGDPASTIRGGLIAFVDYLTEDPRRARIILIEVVGVSPAIEELRHGVLRVFADVICSVWASQPGVDAASEPSRLTAIALVGAVNNLLVDWMMTGRRQAPEILVDVSANLFDAALTVLCRAGDSP